MNEQTINQDPDVVSARTVLFGSPPRTARLVATERPRRERMGRAAAAFGIALLLAPLLFLIPPHVPWALGALLVGGFIARRQWGGALRVHELDAACPRCDTQLELDSPLITLPLKIPCYACHHEPVLEAGA